MAITLAQHVMHATMLCMLGTGTKQVTHVVRLSCAWLCAACFTVKRSVVMYDIQLMMTRLKGPYRLLPK